MTFPSETGAAPRPTLADLPEDAQCLHCGYHLRGLSEPRCPECGTPFDPAEHIDTFIPRWPRLLMWYLLMRALGMILFTPWFLQQINSLLLVSWPQDALDWLNLSWLMHWALNLGPGLVAAVGLYRGQDWGRKACIALFGAVLANWLLLSVGFFLAAIWTADPSFQDPGLFSYLILSIIGAVLPKILLLVFLLTGLRPKSMKRSFADLPTPLSVAEHDPRNDWLQLTRILIGVVGLEQGADLFRHGPQMLFNSFPGMFEAPLMTSIWALATLIALALSLCGILFLKTYPRLVRPIVVMLLPCLITAASIQAWYYCRMWSQVVAAAPSGAIRNQILGAIGSILPWLALTGFILFAVSKHDIRSLSRRRGGSVVEARPCQQATEELTPEN